MLHKTLVILVLLSCAGFAQINCSKTEAYKLYSSAKGNMTLGHRLLATSLVLIAFAGIASIYNKPVTNFFLAIVPIPLFAAGPFYIAGAVQFAELQERIGICDDLNSVFALSITFNY